MTATAPHGGCSYSTWGRSYSPVPGGDHVGWRELCRNDRGLVAISAALPDRWFCARHLGSGRDRFPARERGLQSLRAESARKAPKPGLIFGPTENPLGKAGRKMGVERPVHRRAAI